MRRLVPKARLRRVKSVEFHVSTQASAPRLQAEAGHFSSSQLFHQHPGLMPTARELQSQREIVSEAIDALEQQGVGATGEIIRSRDAAQAIAAKTRRSIYLGIVMAADRAPHWLVRGLLWSHEPYRVGRFTRVPVHLVVDTPPGEHG